MVCPTAIAIDRSNRHLYVLDSPNNLVITLDLNGDVLKKIGKKSTDVIPIQFDYPSEIAIGNNEILILDSAGSRLQILDLEGNLAKQFNTHFSTGRTLRPMGLATDPEGNIYLSNIRDSEIRTFDRDGNILSSLGQSGIKDGQFKNATALLIPAVGSISLTLKIAVSRSFDSAHRARNLYLWRVQTRLAVDRRRQLSGRKIFSYQRVAPYSLPLSRRSSTKAILG